MKLKKALPYLTLTILSLVLIWALTPHGAYFGSTTDWIDQHTIISDIFRQSFYRSGNLFSNYLPGIGSGSSLYAFSYYGLFRPDILISYLLPQVKMIDIITVYSITLMISAINLLYYWLRKKGYDQHLVFCVSCLLMLSTLVFQTHRQIMFVNYLPFLIMALIGIDHYVEKQKVNLLIFGLFMVILHSFYFSIAAILVLYLYYCYLTGFKFKPLLKFTFILLIPVLISSILIIPSGIYLLTNKRATSIHTPLYELFGLNYDLKNLLYYHYGMGLSALAFILTISGIKNPRLRHLIIPVGICLLLNIITFILNGGLYLRDKVYIPFLPLILLIMVQVLTDIKEQKYQLSFLVGLILIPLMAMRFNPLYVIDTLISIILVLLLTKQYRIVSKLLLVMPILICFNSNKAEVYATPKTYPFSEGELKHYIKNDAHYQDLIEPMLSANRLIGNKTSIYSSMVNNRYNTYYYDIAHNAIRIRNRVAILDSKNPIYYVQNGIKYLTSKSDNIPYGYRVVYRKKDHVIAINDQVKPLAYVSYNNFSEKAFDKLKYPYDLNQLIQYSIVADSNIKTVKPINELKTIAKTYHLDLKEPLVKYYDLNLKNKIVFIDFKVLSKKEVTIRINGVKNRLSSLKANYPNGNNHFKYNLVLKDNSKLKVTFYEGKYRIKDLKIHYVDLKTLNQQPFTKVEAISQKQHPLTGKVNISKPGYLITQLPYQNGFKAYIDNQEVKIEKVNKAFVGFKLKPGKHQIKITYEVVGLKAGMIMSGLGLLIWLIIVWRKHEKD